MSVANILAIAAPKLGLDPSADREKLLRLLNEAAYEIYIQADLPGSLEEVVLQVAGDRTLALPSYVGELRAVREFDTRKPWHINQTRQLYNPLNWSQAWRNFRIKGRSPLVSNVLNYSFVTATITATEDFDVVVNIAGSTTDAQRVVDVLTIAKGTLTATGTKQFINIGGITKSVLTATNVTITDIEGNVLSEISNDSLKANYLIVDVSEMPLSTNPPSTRDNVVEVLYKKKLIELSLDTDEFPVIDCDTIISNKIIQIYYQSAGDVKKAEAYDALVNRSLARKVDDVNKSTEDIVGMYQHPHDAIFGRITPNRGAGYYFRDTTQ